MPTTRTSAEFPDRKAFAEWAKTERRPEEAIRARVHGRLQTSRRRDDAALRAKRLDANCVPVLPQQQVLLQVPLLCGAGPGHVGENIGPVLLAADEPVDFDDFEANRFFLALAQQGVRDSGVRGVKLALSHRHIESVHGPRALGRGVQPLVLQRAPRDRWPQPACGSSGGGEQWSSYGAGIAVAKSSPSNRSRPPQTDTPSARLRPALLTNFGAGCSGPTTRASTTGVNYAGSGRTYDGALPGIRMKADAPRAAGTSST